MTVTTLNLKINPKRMLKPQEAAEYCGMQSKYFKMDCNVSPVSMPRGKLLYDINDLDMWLDGMKDNLPDSDDDITARLD